jgi:hypothetical protein
MEPLLTAEEREIRDQVRHFATSKLLPRIVKDNADELFDRKIMNEMGEMGLLGATIKGSQIILNTKENRIWLQWSILCVLWPYCP